MTRGCLLALMLAVSVNHAGCGDDDDADHGSNRKDAGPSSNDDGAGRGGSGTGPAAAGSGLPPFGTPPPPVACGSKTCASPATGFGIITACCADESTSTCGTTFGGGMCATPAQTDPRCPPLNLMGFLMLGSCCTPEGMCGFDASMFGMSGCVDLSAAASGQGLPAIPGLGFPPPRRCDDSAESDAGFAGDQDGGN